MENDNLVVASRRYEFKEDPISLPLLHQRPVDNARPCQPLVVPHKEHAALREHDERGRAAKAGRDETDFERIRAYLNRTGIETSGGLCRTAEQQHATSERFEMRGKR